jgi:hypothetical protein
MPTDFTAQNGLTIHQNTPIITTNCTTHKARKAKASRRDKHHRTRSHKAGNRK